MALLFFDDFVLGVDADLLNLGVEHALGFQPKALKLVAGQQFVVEGGSCVVLAFRMPPAFSTWESNSPVRCSRAFKEGVKWAMPVRSVAVFGTDMVSTVTATSGVEWSSWRMTWRPLSKSNSVNSIGEPRFGLQRKRPRPRLPGTGGESHVGKLNCKIATSGYLASWARAITKERKCKAKGRHFEGWWGADVFWQLSREGWPDIVRGAVAKSALPPAGRASRATPCGINTGFGDLATTRVDDLVGLQRNLLISRVRG